MASRSASARRRRRRSPRRPRTRASGCRARGASPRARARPRQPPRPRPATSCRARRGPTGSRRRRRPTRDRAATRRGRRARCRRDRGSTASVRPRRRRGRRQVRPLVDRRQHLGLEARLLQVLLEVLDRRPLVARRIDGVEADQSLEDVGRLALKVIVVIEAGSLSRRRRTISECLAVAEDLNVALELADVADPITMARFRADDLVVETKPDLTPVSEADTAVERALREMLGEVAAGRRGDGRGVRRLERREPRGAGSSTRSTEPRATCAGSRCGRRCSRSAIEDGEASVAVVSAPALGRRWWAARQGRVHRRRPSAIRGACGSRRSQARRRAAVVRRARGLATATRRFDAIARAGRAVLALAHRRRLLVVHAGRRGRDRDRARPRSRRCGTSPRRS